MVEQENDLHLPTEWTTSLYSLLHTHESETSIAIITKYPQIYWLNTT